MHKKLESDLMSLAHSILQMKNKENVFLLKQKSHEIYEKLSILAFVEEYVNSTAGLKKTKEELLSKVEKGYEAKGLISDELEVVEPAETVVSNFTEDFLKVENEKLSAEIAEDFSEEDTELEDKVASIHEYLEVEKEVEMEQPFDAIEGAIFGDTETADSKEDLKDVEERRDLTLEEELKDTIPVDVMATLFEPVKGASLNDKLQTNIQIGLNDRIAFVKNLFEGSQEDFNRVISQLNTLKTEKEVKKFINKIVKPDYNWSEQEDLENRLMAIIERRFA
jgi:hypothetical protein